MKKLEGKPIRRVKVSKQRQVSIPKDFYNALDIDDEVIIEFTGKELIIRTVGSEDVDFSKDILEDLTARGYTGNELIQEFVKVKSNIPVALDYMKKEAMEHPLIAESLDDYLDSVEDEEVEWTTTIQNGK